MDLKTAYRRFKRWQQDPFEYKSNSQKTHCCNNCGNDFVGNYCPICSQKENVGRITWKSVLQSLAEVWGLNNRSLIYSLVQLFLRPGYFISDYISGKRMVSFPPVKMLAIIALLGIFLDYLIGTNGTVGVFDNDFDFEGDKMLFIDNAFEWMNSHPDFMSVIMLSYLIIPVYFLFRFAPRNSHHTLPQGFFIQVFTSVAFLIINMLYDLTSMMWFAFVLGFVWLFVTYRQLFGYNVWGTLWRIVLALICAVLIALILLGVDFSVHAFQTGNYNLATGFKLFVKLLVRMVTNSDV